MVDVRSLLPGLFITSLIVLFGLWLSSLASFSVVEINAVPQKTTVATVIPQKVAGITTDNTQTNQMINSQPKVFANRSYTWKTPKATEVANMTSLVSGELAEYSDSYLNNIGLRQIILVDDIQNRARQPVLGFSDPLAGKIYLNTVELEGKYSRSVVAEQTVHHEIAHFLAYARYGYWFDRDSGWQQLSQNYSYGDVANTSQEYFPRDGFVSRYSMSSPGEDFAEVYSLIYTEYFQSRLGDEASGSELLENKARFVYKTISQVDPAQCLASYQTVESACD